MLDDADLRLLRRLQGDPAQTVTDLASATAMPISRVQRRLDRLRETGVIRATRAVIDWEALGYAVKVSLRFTLDKAEPNAFDLFIAAARAVPEVIEIQTFLGKVDVRLCVIARNMGHYQRLYRTSILSLPHIADIDALMHVATIKAQETLPI